MAEPEKPKAKSKRGGPRPNSGRKTTAFNKSRAEILAAIDKGNVERLPKLFENLFKLADGGYERVEEEWVPGDAPLAQPGTTSSEPPLVLAKRKVSVAEPDRASNQYLIDRILGRPRQSVEVTDAGADPSRRIMIPDADERSSEEHPS